MQVERGNKATRLAVPHATRIPSAIALQRNGFNEMAALANSANEDCARVEANVFCEITTPASALCRLLFLLSQKLRRIWGGEVVSGEAQPTVACLAAPLDKASKESQAARDVCMDIRYPAYVSFGRNSYPRGRAAFAGGTAACQWWPSVEAWSLSAKGTLRVLGVGATDFKCSFVAQHTTNVDLSHDNATPIAKGAHFTGLEHSSRRGSTRIIPQPSQVVRPVGIETV
ncbi:hypothetical protein CPLU01_05460 [Colletotrichum plurivorum]|uniref:Uncharacterized protein n=1 Tax=Colletotrichum plurivorum TaxID=2175906 RepID=A0A8H6NHG9_9PEZI|nr:hypothetical protein CPLU01_05460 [Colletotrichum plurivorum]